MISAKNKQSGEVLNFTEKDFNAIQIHFPDMFEKIGEVENTPIGEDELIIEVVKPKVNSDELNKIIDTTIKVVDNSIKHNEQSKKRGRSKK